jgi:hypothetical protein
MASGAGGAMTGTTVTGVFCAKADNATMPSKASQSLPFAAAGTRFFKPGAAAARPISRFMFFPRPIPLAVISQCQFIVVIGLGM